MLFLSEINFQLKKIDTLCMNSGMMEWVPNLKKKECQIRTCLESINSIKIKYFKHWIQLDLLLGDRHLS